MDTESFTIHSFKEGDLFDDRYRLVELAGSGGFADVWKAEDSLRKNRVVALKIYTRLDEEGIKQMSEEYDETEYIQHPNLLTGNHFATVGNIPYLEMRYCDGGSMVGRVGRMSNEELRHMLCDIVKGLAYLHKEGVVHQDIKPDNILYDSKHDTYLLADFGISSKTRTRLSKSAKFSDRVYSRTSEYAPPEKFSGNMVDAEPDIKGDIFSLGMTLFELAVGKLPFDPPMAAGREMFYSQGRLQLDYSKIQDLQIRKIVEACTRYRKEERPTAESISTKLAASDSQTGGRQAYDRPPTQIISNNDNDKKNNNQKRTTEPINKQKPPTTAYIPKEKIKANTEFAQKKNKLSDQLNDLFYSSPLFRYLFLLGSFAPIIITAITAIVNPNWSDWWLWLPLWVITPVVIIAFGMIICIIKNKNNV